MPKSITIWFPIPEQKITEMQYIAHLLSHRDCDWPVCGVCEALRPIGDRERRKKGIHLAGHQTASSSNSSFNFVSSSKRPEIVKVLTAFNIK